MPPSGSSSQWRCLQGAVLQTLHYSSTLRECLVIKLSKCLLLLTSPMPSLGGWWDMVQTERVHLVTFWWPKSENELTNPAIMQTPEGVKRFLERVLPAVPLDVDTVAQNYISQAPSTETQLKTSTYHHNAGKVVIMGDAAHHCTSALGQVKDSPPCPSWSFVPQSLHGIGIGLWAARCH